MFDQPRCFLRRRFGVIEGKHLALAGVPICGDLSWLFSTSAQALPGRPKTPSTSGRGGRHSMAHSPGPSTRSYRQSLPETGKGQRPLARALPLHRAATSSAADCACYKGGDMRTQNVTRTSATRVFRNLTAGVGNPPLLYRRPAPSIWSGKRRNWAGPDDELDDYRRQRHYASGYRGPNGYHEVPRQPASLARWRHWYQSPIDATCS